MHSSPAEHDEEGEAALALLPRQVTLHGPSLAPPRRYEDDKANVVLGWQRGASPR
jgi:hypothetical protein